MTFAHRARRSLIVMAVVAALLVTLALALPHLLDVNRFRGRIAEAIRAATGRSVALGRISFELLPAPALAIAPLAVSDSAGYPGREALQAESLSVRLGILGLLRGRLTLGSVVLKRPTLTLIRDARGAWNFDDLLARAAASPGEAPGLPPPAPDGGLTLSIGRATIRSGRLLLYDDAVAPGRRSQVSFGPIDATLSGWGPGALTRFDLAVGLGGSVLRASGRMVAGDKPRLEGDLGGRSILAADLVRLLPWLGVARPGGLEVGGAIDLGGRAVLPLDRPEAIRFNGTLRLHDLSYRDAGMSRPVGKLGGTLTIDGDRAIWNDFAVGIGSSSLEGKLSVEQFLKPRVGFTLASGRLDLNEILGTFTPPASPARAPAPGRPQAQSPPREAEETTGLFEQVRANGSLSVRGIRFQAFDLSDVRAALVLERGVASLKGLQARFYGGTLAGTAEVDLTRPVPRYTFGVRMDGVEVNPLVAAYDVSLAGLLRGTLAGNLDVDASGLEMKPILSSASGSGVFEIARGSITSFSVLKQLAALLELAGGKGIGRDETAFDSLSAHLAIASGRASTDDLKLRASDLDLEGKGSVGLDATMKLGVTARFSEEATRGMVAKTPPLSILADRQDRLTIHFALEGSLASPSFRLDAASQSRDIQERKKQEAKEKVLERLEKRLHKGLGQDEPVEKPQP